MAIDDVIEKTRIYFPRSIDLEEAEELLRYVAEGLSANVHYSIQYLRTLHHADDGRLMNLAGAVRITADVSSLGDTRAFDSLRFEPSVACTSRLLMIEFERVPGWELSEYRHEVRKLWDDTRRVVGEYFDKPT